MSEFLFQYEKVNPISWAYLSSLLTIGLFFKFNRFWSVRNLDLVLLILLAPGLLMVKEALHDTAAVPPAPAEATAVSGSLGTTFIALVDPAAAPAPARSSPQSLL